MNRSCSQSVFRVVRWLAAFRAHYGRFFTVGHTIDDIDRCASAVADSSSCYNPYDGLTGGGGTAPE